MDMTISARSLMAEIPSETLQELLNEVRWETAPPGSTEISALDAHLRSNAARLSATLSALNRGDVLEIQGPASSGKTQLVYHLLANCILPMTWRSHKIGGWDKIAVLLDSDASLDIKRMKSIILTRLSNCIEDTNLDGGPSNRDHQHDLDAVARTALRNLHVFRPSSSLQLATTLSNLPAYHTAHLADSEIALLVVDSIGAFYWPDRYSGEQMRAAAPQADPTVAAAVLSVGIPSVGTANAVSPLHHVLTALERVRRSLGVVTVMTNWGLNPVPAAQSPFYRQHLFPFPAPLAQSAAPAPAEANAPSASSATRAQGHGSTAFAMDRDAHPAAPQQASDSYPPITHHITLPPVHIPQFPAAFSLAEVRAHEDKYRREVVSRAEVVGLVRTPGSASVGKFSFRIGDNDILVRH